MKHRELRGVTAAGRKACSDQGVLTRARGRPKREVNEAVDVCFGPQTDMVPGFACAARQARGLLKKGKRATKLRPSARAVYRCLGCNFWRVGWKTFLISEIS